MTTKNRVQYSEGLDVGYRWYQAEHVAPASPFGYGLSYTSFRLSKLKVRPLTGAGAADRYRVSVTVTNTGTRRGWAVPELYLSIPSTSALPQPPDELKGFTKLSLAPRRHAPPPSP